MAQRGCTINPVMFDDDDEFEMRPQQQTTAATEKWVQSISEASTTSPPAPPLHPLETDAAVEAHRQQLLGERKQFLGEIKDIVQDGVRNGITSVMQKLGHYDSEVHILIRIV